MGLKIRHRVDHADDLDHSCHAIQIAHMMLDGGQQLERQGPCRPVGTDKLTNSATGMRECHASFDLEIGSEWALASIYRALRPLSGSASPRLHVNLSIPPRHAFGRRLRSAGIPLETRKALLGHANGDITTHYSAAELEELINAVEAIVNRGRTETPNLMLIRQRTERSVGKKKRASSENPLTL